MFFKTLKQKLDLKKFRPFSGQRGQSLVEMAIAAPIMLIMLIGVLEVGWALRGYMVLANANREATRFAVKTGTLDFSIKNTDTIGYDRVLSHTLASLSNELPLEFGSSDTNNTMIISHFVADTRLPCARMSGGNPVVPYEFDASNCDCTVDDQDDAQWFTDDDLIAHPGDPLYPHYVVTFGISQTTRLDYEEQIAEMTLVNNQANCALLKANPNASLSNTANNMIIIENFYEQPQLAGVPFISNQLTDPIPFYTHTAMRIVCSRDGCTESIGPTCEVYPITFPETSLPDPDSPIPDYPVDAFEGDGEGNFGWLNWDPGDNSNPYLIEEMYNPRLSMEDFVGLTPPPDLDEDSSNTTLNIGDWVSGSTGVNTSSGVQEQLDGLIGKPIRIPVYDIADGTGSNKGYHISHFALVTIHKICLPSNQCGQDLGLHGNEKAIYATFHRYDDEACSSDMQSAGPDANNDDYRDTPMNRDAGPVTLDVLANDSGDGITIVSIVQPDEGTVTVIDSGSRLTYEPRDHHHGEGDFTFNYTIRDSSGLTDWATIRVRVVAGGANTPPTADDQSVETDQDTDLAITLDGSDLDGDSLTYRVLTPPSHGTLLGTAPNLTYRPDAGYSGTDSFTFDAFDGTAYSNEATVSITVISTNTPPTAHNKTVDTTEGMPVDITLTGADAESDPLTFGVIDGPTHGTLSGTGDSLTYTPDSGYTGADSFTYKANDGTADSNLATVSITVNALAGTYDQLEARHSSKCVDVASSSTADGGNIHQWSCHGGDNQQWTFIEMGGGYYQARVKHSGKCLDVSGASTSDGASIVQNACGSGDSQLWEKIDMGGGYFQLKNKNSSRCMDVSGGSSSDGANLIQWSCHTNYNQQWGGGGASGNQSPVAGDDTATTNEDTAVTIDAGANDDDPDGDSLVYSIDSTPTNGNVVYNGNGQYTYTPNSGYTGADSFTYSVSDANGGSDTATVTITVTAAAPQLVTIASDDFSSGGWSGSGGSDDPGWSDDWNVNDNKTDIDGGEMRLRKVGEAIRTVNLTGATATSLSFQWRADSLDGSESAEFSINDGSGWPATPELVVPNGDDDNNNHTKTIDLTGYSFGDSFQIRFKINGSGNKDYFYIDDIVISGTKP